MEPDVICMCSSSPLPMDKVSEEENDDFGDFGGFSSTGQARELDTSPLSFGGLTKGSGDLVYKLSSGKLRGISHGFSLAKRVSETKDLKGSTDFPHPIAGCKCAGPEVDRCWTEGNTCSFGGGMAATRVLNGSEDDPYSVPLAVEPSQGRHLPVAEDSSGHLVVSTQTCFPWPADNNKLAGEHLNGFTEGNDGWDVSPLLAAMYLNTNRAQDVCHVRPGLYGCPTMGEEDLRNGCWDGTASVIPKDQNGGRLTYNPRVEELGLMANGECEMQKSGSVHTVSTSTSGDFASFCEAVSPDSQEDFGPKAVDSEEVRGTRGVVSVDLNQMQSVIQDDSAGPSKESSDGSKTGGFDPLNHCDQEEGVDGCFGQSGDFPSSDSFADFHSAPLDLDAVPEWDTFGGQGRVRSWDVFRSGQSAAYSEEGEKQLQDGTITGARRDSLLVSPSSCLENLFRASFPLEPTVEAKEEVFALWMALKGQGGETDVAGHQMPQNIWFQLQDFHCVVGLRHRWTDSHSNKALLSSLGIDTQDTLFTSRRKQLAAAPAHSTGLQETLLPVQFDWSNSGLTDPLDGMSLRRNACAPQFRQSPIS